MNKYEALHKFYGSFGIPAYEEHSVPGDATFPYISYESVTSVLSEQNIALTCKLNFKTTSFLKINALTEKISAALRGGKKLVCDEGYIVLYNGTPFAQNVPSGDNGVKTKYINITADYITL